MSSPPSASTVELRLQPSRLALRLLLTLHALVLLGLLATLEPGVPMALFALATGLSWYWLRRHPAFGYGPRAIIRVVAQGDGGWRLTDARGTEYQARLLGDSYRHSRLLILNFRLENGVRCSRALLGDECPAESLRRLRVRLGEASDRNP